MDICPIEQSEIEKNPKDILLRTAREIIEYKLTTLQADSPIYIEHQQNKINSLELDLKSPSRGEMITPQSTLLGTLFFFCLRQLSVPIQPSIAEDDRVGIDFYIFDKPIDTIHQDEPLALQKKLNEQHSATILRIPRFMNPTFVKPPRYERLILQAFFENKLTPEEYLNTVLILNKSFKGVLTKNLTGRYPETGGYKFKNVDGAQVNNVHNMIEYLSRFL